MRLASSIWVAVLLAASATPAHADDLVAVKAPFVGCTSGGQAGTIEPPTGAAKAFSLSLKLPGAIAFYKGAQGIGVFAPAGWHCVVSYGSAGATIIVSAKPIPTSSFDPSDTPVLELSTFDGGTSGRFIVAEYGWMLFPDLTKEYVKRVEDEGIEPKSDIETPKSPTDRIAYLNAKLVSFDTPAGLEGLGTSRYVKVSLTPISGLLALDDSGDMSVSILRMSLGNQADTWSRFLMMLNIPCVTGNPLCSSDAAK